MIKDIMKHHPKKGFILILDKKHPLSNTFHRDIKLRGGRIHRNKKKYSRKVKDQSDW
jgi:hypothetical protein